MTNIELYINQQLCDIQSPEKLGIRLNRVLINPSELSTKDAQYSYSITIPSSPTNDAIFNYANVEEVKNKFNHNHTAQVYVNSVMVFDGRFKLSEIDAEGNYKGNLVVPAKKTVKDIFGEKKMTEIDTAWKLDFSDANSPDGVLSLTEMLNKYNTMEGTPDCIFPLVLYGLLPKVPKTITQEEGQEEQTEYSGKTLWDKYVRLGVEDFPPSINCLKTIQQIFGKSKEDDTVYNITGSAFNDERLSKLYMSYQNPTDYQQEWNWGHLGKMRISGNWTNMDNDNGAVLRSHLETEFVETQSDHEHVAVNLFRSRNAKIQIEEDRGNNIYQFQSKKENVTINNTQIVIPVSGLYKITFSGTMQVVGSNTNAGSSNRDLGLRFAYENSHEAHNRFGSCRYELKLVRDRATGSLDMDEAVIDGVFYKNNHNQKKDKVKDYDKIHGFQFFETYPKYFPQDSPHSVLWVDPAQNPNIVLGFRWGKTDRSDEENPVDRTGLHCNILAAKHGFSWDKTIDTYNYSAVKSGPYWEYGILPPANDESEELEEGEEDNLIKELGYRLRNKYRVELDSPNNIIQRSSDALGNGIVHAVVWLNKGERISVIDVADKGVWRSGDRHKKKQAYIKHAVSFKLEIEPYQTKQEWITINSKGTGTAPMQWNAPSDFLKSHIDLVKFLPSEQKIDEWLDNFCKAFNLELTQPEENKFELNTKQTNMMAAAPSVLDIDHKASLLHRTNQPLGLPSQFQLGFKINKEERGYIESKIANNDIAKDGGGSLHTGNLDGAVVSQSSSFSYNWFKEDMVKDIVVGKDGEGKDIMGKLSLKLPVISNNEIWKSPEAFDYAEMQKKLYTNYAQRMWYKDEYKPLYNVGQVWKNPQITELKPEEQPKHPDLLLPQLTETIEGMNTMSLNYYDEPNTILTTYFNIIATDDSNYTYVECYLTPDEYEQLDGTKLVQLNGDLYYIAALEGYDPTGLSKTKLKLMRRV